MTLLLALLVASAPAPTPFKIVEIREPKRILPILLARAGNEERYVGVACFSPKRLVPLARMPGVKKFWAEPGSLAGGHRVRYHFDAGPELSARWRGRGDFVGAVEAVSKPDEFIKGLTNASRVHLRIYEAGKRFVEDDFSFTGAAEAISELKIRCGVPSVGMPTAK